MQKLSQRNQELISTGLKTCGNSMDAYYYIEEELYVSQAEKIHDFMDWLFKINRPFGRANAQDRWKEFLRGDQPPKEYFNLEYGFSYTVAGFKQNAHDSERMKEPTLERIALYMMDKNWELDYWFKIVNQNGETVKEFTKEEVYEKAMQLKEDGVKPTGELFKIQNGYI